MYYEKYLCSLFKSALFPLLKHKNTHVFVWSVPPAYRDLYFIFGRASLWDWQRLCSKSSKIGFFKNNKFLESLTGEFLVQNRSIFVTGWLDFRILHKLRFLTVWRLDLSNSTVQYSMWRAPEGKSNRSLSVKLSACWLFPCQIISLFFIKSALATWTV